jgi:hypothetical protein
MRGGMDTRPLLLAMIASTTGLSTACHYFEHRDPPDMFGRVEYTYDDRLPLALEDFFSHCEPEYHFTPNVGPVTVALPHGGACANQLTPAAALLFPRLTETLYTNGIRGSLINQTFMEYGFWGHQSAYFDFTMSFDVNPFFIRPIAAEWAEPTPGQAALKITFTFPAQNSIIDVNYTPGRCRTGCTSFTPANCNHIDEANCQNPLDAIPSQVSMQMQSVPLEVFFIFEPDPNGPGLGVRTKAEFGLVPYFTWNASSYAIPSWRDAMRGFEEQSANRRHWENGSMIAMLDSFALTILPIAGLIRDQIESPVQADEFVDGVRVDPEANRMELRCVGTPPEKEKR